MSIATVNRSIVPPCEKPSNDVRDQLLDLIRQRAEALPHETLAAMFTGLVGTLPTLDVWQIAGYLARRYAPPPPRH
jgi:hypothetical protein